MDNFFATAAEDQMATVAVPNMSGGIFVMDAPLGLREGTFLARSANPRARALAAVMLAYEARTYANCTTRR